MLADGDQLTSCNTITASDLQDTYYIIRDPSEVITAMRNPEAKYYIVLPEVSLDTVHINFPVRCNGWVFTKALSIVNSSFEKEVDFRNCVFLGNLLLDMNHFESLLNLDYSVVTKAEFTHIEFGKSGASFYRFSVVDHLNITYCEFKSRFYFEYRKCIYKLNRPFPRPVFNFSSSLFHSSFHLAFSYNNDPKPVIILYKTVLKGDIDINYNALKKNGYRSLIFDHNLYLKSISDSLLDKVNSNDTDNPMLKYKTIEVIRGNFETLTLYYQNRDTDRMLDLRYLYRKYNNKLRLYENEHIFSSHAIKNRLHWFSTLILLDLPFKYFTSWKATLITIIGTLFLFFNVFMLFANYIHDSSGNPLTSQQFYINFNDKLDIDRIGNVLYFTLVTFTTIGYGDYHPTGFLKIVAGFEGLIGMLLASIFIVTLARRILG